MIRVAINGYGRIGRLAHRVILEKYSSEISVAAINVGSSTDVKGWMYLLKYDTAYGVLPSSVILNSVQDLDPNLHRDDNGEIGHFIIDDQKIPVFSQKDPSLLPWKDLTIDVVIESTGHFKTREKIKSHITAGAKAVVLSAPSSEGDIPVYVLAVNAKDYKGEDIISNASCTTNCIAPVAKIMGEKFGIEKAMMTTIHGYTSDQKLQDCGHKDYRRARAAAYNIIPTNTGATNAAIKALPSLLNKFSGLAIRVPVITGSLSDFTFLVSKNTTKDEVNSVFKMASESTEYKGILDVTTDPIVSSDIIGNSHSSIIDLSLTQVVCGNMVKVIAWYDNEYGYANRLAEEVLMVGKQI